MTNWQRYLYGHTSSGDEVFINVPDQFVPRGGTGGEKTIDEIQRNRYLITPDSDDEGREKLDD